MTELNRFKVGSNIVPEKDASGYARADSVTMPHVETPATAPLPTPDSVEMNGETQSA
jgi:hypothetical protein